MATLEEALAKVDALFAERIEAAEARRAARTAEIEEEKKVRTRQEREKFQTKREREQGEKQRRKKGAEQTFALQEEELQAALQTLLGRLSREKESTVEDTELSREESLEDVVNNALERGIFRSGIREEGEQDVNERANELILRAEEGYTAESEAGEEETALRVRGAALTRDLEIEDALADYDELLAQLEQERDAAIENYDIDAAQAISQVISSTADQIYALEDERDLRKAGLEEKAALRDKEKAASKSAAPAGGGGGGYAGGGGGAPVTRTSVATAVAPMKPIVIPKNIMTPTPSRGALPRTRTSSRVAKRTSSRTTARSGGGYRAI